MRFREGRTWACANRLRMMRFPHYAAAIALGALVLAGCQDGGMPPGAQFSSVAGTVLDSMTQQPLAGAIVTVDSVLAVTTDANGKFSIARAPSGILDYSVQASGYTPLSASADTAPGKPLKLNVRLDPAASTPTPAPTPTP